MNNTNASLPKKYLTHVKPRLGEVTAWVREGWGKEPIAKYLGISLGTYNKYLDEIQELSRAVAEGKTDWVARVDNVLHNQLFYLQTTRKVKEKYELNKDGDLVCTEREITIQEHLPSEGLIRLGYQRGGVFDSGGAGSGSQHALPRIHAPEPDQTRVLGPPPLKIISYNDPDYIDVEFTDVTGTDDIRANQAAE